MPDDNAVTHYRIEHLYEAFERLEKQMREGFGELKRLLDERLESRDRTLLDHEKRLQEMERRLAQQKTVNGILTALGGTTMTAVLAYMLRQLLGS